jgi:hypothetical protein
VHGAAAWLSATVCDPTTIDPDRATGTGLAATVYGIDASPCPLRSPPSVTQFVVVAIDHVQSRAAAIVTEPVPPAAVNDSAVVVAVTWHLASCVGPITDVSVLLHATSPERAIARAAV